MKWKMDGMNKSSKTKLLRIAIIILVIASIKIIHKEKRSKL